MLQDGILGDEEIAVRIRSNSHYRISCPQGQVKSECSSVCHTEKVSWANGEIVKKRHGTDAWRYFGVSRTPLHKHPGEVLFFYPFVR